MPRVLTAALAMWCLLTLTGCVEKSTVDGATVITNASWVYGLIGLAGLALTIVGAVAIKGNWWQGSITLLVGLGILLVAAPTYFLEKTTVRDDGFEVKTGVFGGTVHNVTYADIGTMEQTSEEVRGRRGRRTTKYYLLLHMKSGGDIKLDASGGVDAEAVPLIEEKARAHGVKMLGEDFEEPVDPAEPVAPVDSGESTEPAKPAESAE
jgi:hypothetical protein